MFRHFATKDELLAAFWPWLNARIGVSIMPENLSEIVDGPRRTFPMFDIHEAAIRASIHSPTGREMRLGTVARRRANFAHALAPAVASIPADEARKVEALAHLLFSASAWEVLKDYGGLTGAQAGETASWALGMILSAVSSGRSAADSSSQTQETSNED